jgi:hypothetical protein
MSTPFGRPVQAESIPAELKTIPRFLASVFKDLPAGARPWVAGFRADPYHPKARWGGCQVNGQIPDFIEPEANCYLAVSSFKPGDDGKIHRRKANFAAMHLVMIDDVGTKVPPSAITLDPSYLLETSPGNYQAGYLLTEPVTDQELCGAVVDALVAQGLMTEGKDPGMKGVTRYGRLPVGINNKPALVAEHGEPFRVRLAEWEPDRRYTLADIIGAYRLTLGKASVAAPVAPSDNDPLLQWLADQGRIQGAANTEGWTPISCPWVDEHTDRADTGAAYLPPSGFKCHHGHCEQRTIHDLRAWAKGHGWAKEQDAGVDPDLAARCGIGPVQELQAAEDLDAEFIPIGSFIANPPDSSYLVKGVLPASGMGQVFGNSHAGKSFLLIDLACHLALGWDWHGYKVKKTAVLYIAAEGVAGLKLRFRAWFQAHNVAPPDNLRIRTIPANLTALDATAALRERMNRLPAPPGAVFVDTLATNFGPGSENDAEDMNTAIAGLKTLMDSGLLLSAHHTGHADKTRSRGHSSLFAALDVELHVTQDEDKVIRVGHTKLRDGDKLNTIAAFELEKVALPWADVDGDPLNSAVLAQTDAPPHPPAQDRTTPAQRIALDALKTALAEQGIEEKGVVAVAEDQWRQTAYSAGISSSDSTQNARRMAFTRARDGLVATQKVACFDGRYWIPATRTEPHRAAQSALVCGYGMDAQTAQNRTHPFRGVRYVRVSDTPNPEPNDNDKISANVRVEDSPFTQRIINTLSASSCGLAQADLLRLVGNGKGASPAMLTAEINRLLLARRIATVNGKLVLEVR